MLNRDLMLTRGESLKEAYKSADPFPHVVIDDFLPLEVAKGLVKDFPTPKNMDEATYQVFENKIASRPNVPGFPEYSTSVLYALNSDEIITFLEILTGINGLVADPHYLGAGLHQTMPGGKLKIHVDFNFHKHLSLDRRVNMLIYLNEDWQEEWGGHLELWSQDMSRCAQRITPKFNRCVIFSTTNTSYHGHPDPLTCPANQTRKSIVLYYYTNGRPENEQREAFWTQHQKRPGSNQDNFKQTAEKIALNFIPPVFVKLWKRGF
jgi:Rps23 Pro-64 3,4-dihydroxylase Tpa1-like proline 4-hydroxylase